MLLTGCSVEKVAENVKEHYPLESVNGKGNQTSYVYRAVGQSVQEVAAQLSQQRKPEQKSKASDERMFLVYSDEIIHIQRDTTHPKDSLIEIDSKEYVQKNYSPGFLEGYLLSSLISNLFSGKSGGDYRGYSTKDTYKPDGAYHKPTLEEKKKHPPLTADRVGSITKRSKDANTTRGTLKNDPRNTQKSGYGNSNWRSGYEKHRAPRISSRSGSITRRRR
jgi:hypothetical protein